MVVPYVSSLIMHIYSIKGISHVNICLLIEQLGFNLKAQLSRIPTRLFSRFESKDICGYLSKL